uniref:Uncharacterized protein n=1 Tax=Anguilla anguilla TaxID=7936 RepID=A0A0E9UK48_ANGAN
MPQKHVLPTVVLNVLQEAFKSSESLTLCLDTIYL